MKQFFKIIVLWALRICANIQIKKIKPKIIGVGGSNGKTSLANFIYLILKEKYKVKETKGKNSESGIPLSILNIEMNNFKAIDWLSAIIKAKLKVFFDFKKYDFLIAEMGIDSPNPPGNMEYLLKIIKPDIGVLTNITLEHSQYFDPLVDDDKKRDKKILDLIAKQELLLLSSVGDKGIAVLNLDDKKINSFQHQVKAKKITVSMKDKNASFYITKVEQSIDGFKVDFIFTNEKFQIKISNPLPIHYAYSLILALAIGFNCGVSVEKGISILETNYTLPPGRFSVFEGIKDTTVIDSSYNSNLNPLLDAIALVNKVGGKRRKIAILGDMREQGTLSEKVHKQVANSILSNLDFAILIGPNMQKYAAPELEAKKFSFKSYDDFKSAKEHIMSLIAKEDIILVKGSQNTLFLERVVEMLLKDKKDKEKLCRRGLFWDLKRGEN